MSNSSYWKDCIMLENIIGPIAGALGISGLGWQLYKMVQFRQTKAISYSLSILLGCSISLWMIYGISKNDPVIYLPNAILVAILGGIFAYKTKKERHEEMRN